MSSFQMLVELWLEDIVPPHVMLSDGELEDLEIEHIPLWKREAA